MIDILGLGTRHGLNGFEQIAILGVLLVAFISLAIRLAAARHCPEKGQRHRRRCRKSGMPSALARIAI